MFIIYIRDLIKIKILAWIKKEIRIHIILLALNKVTRETERETERFDDIM